jgi:crotonobetainyl-CoA:carnitine CoA-transferase CaiB-like acyl-CoA transferase
VDDNEVRELLGFSGLDFAPGSSVQVSGNGPFFTNRFNIDEAAAVALALTGSAAARLWKLRTGQDQTVAVELRAAAAATSGTSIDRLDGQPLTRVERSTTDFYECRAGDWIHLQGGLPHLHSGTLAVLGCADDRASVAAAVKRWDSYELEEELAARQLCGARARTAAEWAAHPHGSVVTAAPTVEILELGDADPVAPSAGPRPLSGYRVLEFARILAAPVTGRTLAEHGAQVLNVTTPDMPNLNNCEIDTGLGKRSCYLDLNDAQELSRVHDLALTSDVVINGYRSGSLEKRGLDPYELAEKRPGIVYVSINCYGHEGPWVGRRGWEQMAQSASGLAMGQGEGIRPLRAPAMYPGDHRQSTAPDDYVTGFLGAYGAMEALARRAKQGGSWWVRVSLCQTASWFQRCGRVESPESAPGLGDVSDLCQTTPTSFGNLNHLAPVVQMSATPPRWELPPPVRGSGRPAWEL